ncbi:MAG: squalene synthase HpnC [Gammaproteobacteria bacterium]
MLVNEQKIAQAHYENFPVIPFFLPREWRKPIALIYAFARIADDYADEGDDTPEIRLEKLDALANGLSDPKTPFFESLATIIQDYQLPSQLFYDLLAAFKQDVVQSRYPSPEAVLAYCHLSARPIGRLLLHLTGHYREDIAIYSDHICASLQLINFLQDWHDDLIKRSRLYIPQSELTQFKISEDDILSQQDSPEIRALINVQWQRAYDLLSAGTPLLTHLSGRFRWMIALTVEGAFELLDRLQKRASPFDRPILSKWDWLKLTSRLCLKKVH